MGHELMLPVVLILLRLQGRDPLVLKSSETGIGTCAGLGSFLRILC